MAFARPVRPPRARLNPCRGPDSLTPSEQRAAEQVLTRMATILEAL
jgi:hypothetical protein